jgi:3',5'-cyclic AMP phosphodiesterase CpdA
MKIAWFTDIHLDLVDSEGIERFFDSVAEAEPDIVLNGGDVGRSETFPGHLSRLVRRLERPVYFVLGNHDVYGSSFADVHEAARELSRYHRHLHWLPEQGMVPLTDETVLIGHGLWGDGRAGNARSSMVELADHHLVEDLAGADRGQLFDRLNALGDEAAKWTRAHLTHALDSAEQVIFLTHVPPFVGPGRRLDRASSADDLPFYICTAVGDTVVEIMTEHPTQHLTVLSGHRHIASEFDPLPNVHAVTGGARYMHPKLQDLLEIE